MDLGEAFVEERVEAALALRGVVPDRVERSLRHRVGRVAQHCEEAAAALAVGAGPRLAAAWGTVVVGAAEREPAGTRPPCSAVIATAAAWRRSARRG